MSVENKAENHLIEIRVGSHLVEIDSTLLEPNALNSVNATTNKIGYYICADRYILTTEAKAKNWRFSTLLFQTDLEKISQLFFSIHSGVLKKEKQLEGKYNLSYTVGAVKLFHYLNYQIEKRNKKIDTFLSGKIFKFLERIPFIKSYLESWYPKIRDVNEMMMNSFSALWLKGKDEIATKEQILEIECFVGSVDRKGLKCLETYKNTLQEFKAFQAVLPYKDPTKIAEKLGKLEGEELKTAYNEMKAHFEKAESTTYYAQCANWSALKQGLEETYRKRLEETDPILKKANEILGKENVLGVTFEDSYERINKACNDLLSNFSEGCKQHFPESSKKKIDEAIVSIKRAYYDMQADRINHLARKASSKEPSPKEVFGCQDFATCRRRFKALLTNWKDECKKHKSARGTILKAYRVLLKEQLFPLNLPFSSFSEMKLRYEYLRDLIQDYDIVVLPQNYKSKKEVLDILEAQREKCEKRLFPAVYEVEGIANNLGVLPIKPEDMTLALYIGVDQKGIQELEAQLASFDGILQKKKSSESLPPEMKEKLDAAFKKAGKRVAAEYTQHLESIQKKITNSPSAGPGKTNSVINLFQRAYSSFTNLFSIKEANFNRAREQFIKVLFLDVNASHTDIILRAETIGHLLNFLDKKYTELFQTKQKAYERSLVLLELHKTLTENPELTLMKIIDPNDEIKDNMLVLENKVESLLTTLSEELQERSETYDKATVDRLNQIKTLVETSWDALLKEKYALIFKYDLPVDENLDEALFPKLQEEEALTKKEKILHELKQIENSNLPKAIKEKISYVRDVIALAFQLKVAKNICNKTLITRNYDYYSDNFKKEYLTDQYGISSNSTEKVIRTRYRTLCTIFHPDRSKYKDGFLSNEIKEFLEKSKSLPNPKDFLPEQKNKK